MLYADLLEIVNVGMGGSFASEIQTLFGYWKTPNIREHLIFSQIREAVGHGQLQIFSLCRYVPDIGVKIRIHVNGEFTKI